MLKVLRKNYQSIWVKGALSAIVLVFVFWGIGSVGMNRMEVAVRVNDEVISEKQLNFAYDMAQRSMRDRFKGELPAGLLRQQATDELIKTRLLCQEAERLGLAVTDEELRMSIEAQFGGRPSKEAYVQALRSNGLTPAVFEQLQHDDVLSRKVLEVATAGVQVSEAQAKERYRYEKEQVALRIVKLSASTFLDQVTLTDEEIRSYYDARKEQFREPERASLSYLRFSADQFAGAVNPTEDEVRDYYDGHQDQYHKAEEIRARHILFRVMSGVSDEQRTAVRARATEALTKAKAGEDFAALAQKYSEDSSASSGGDLGFFSRGKMVQPFEDAAFGLAVGALSDLVESPFGYHIIKVEEKRAERIDPLETVHDAIVKTLKGERGRRLALERAEKVRERLLDGEDLQAVAQSVNVAVVSPPPFGREEPIAGLPRNAELIKAVFETEAGQVTDVVTLDDGYLVGRVAQRVASFVPELDAARERVEKALRQERASAAAKTRAEALLAQLKERRDVDALAAAEKLTVEDTGPFGRQGGHVPKVGNVQELKDAAFRLTTEQPVAPQVYQAGGDVFIAVLKEHLPADEAKFESEKTTLMEQERRRLERTVSEQFVNYLKGKARIEFGSGRGAAAG